MLATRGKGAPSGATPDFATNWDERIAPSLWYGAAQTHKAPCRIPRTLNRRMPVVAGGQGLTLRPSGY